LAVLAHGDDAARGRSLQRAIQGLNGLPEARRARLANAMAVLATKVLSTSTIDRITKESGMTIESVAQFYEQTEVGQEIRRHGLEQGTARTLTAMLRGRFGEHDHISTIAQNLARYSDDDRSIRLITEATTLDDLAAWLVPAQPTEPDPESGS
jgi:AcrR family transcriptional regulator